LVLAGGLNEVNVAPKIAQLSPYAVDFNSGLETAPGHKEPAKIAAAIRAVNGVG
jgi:phosphoribosylanthranilate isomerase